MSGSDASAAVASGAGTGAGAGAAPAAGASTAAPSGGVPLSPRVYESALFSASADDVWPLLRALDFAALCPSAVTSCAVEEGPAARVGSLRRVTRSDGRVEVLKLDNLSDARRVVEWDLVSADPSPGYASATSTLRVRRVTDTNSSLVQWTTLFSSDAPASVLSAAAAEIRAAFGDLRATLNPAPAGPDFEANAAALAVTELPGSCNHVMMGDAHPLAGCIEAFLKAGGHLLLVDPEAKPDVRTRFAVRPDDLLYPVCSSGQNRSQVLRELLLRRTEAAADKFTGRVELAHACLAGVDPYVDDAMSATVSTADIDRSDKGFTLAFGHPRDPRIGEAENPFGGFYEAGDPFLRKAKVWFNKNFFSRPSDAAEGTRRVYLTFDKPVHGMLKRLVEASAGGSLEDVYVVAIPLGDIVAHPPEPLKRNSAEACKYAFDVFEGLLDLSALA